MKEIYNDQLFWYKSSFSIYIDIFNLLINNFNLLIDSFNLLIDLYWSLNKQKIKNDQFNLKVDQIHIEIGIADTILSLESELDHNRRSKLEDLKSELLTIQFIGPNRMSLVGGGEIFRGVVLGRGYLMSRMGFYSQAIMDYSLPLR